LSLLNEANCIINTISNYSEVSRYQFLKKTVGVSELVCTDIAKQHIQIMNINL